MDVLLPDVAICVDSLSTAAVIPAHIAALADSSEHEDAYARHFKLVLRTVTVERPDLAKLLSPQERALADAFLHALSPVEQQLYARLFQRKGSWFKTTALFRYFMLKPYVVAAANADDDADEVADADAATAIDTVDNSNDNDVVASEVTNDTASELPDNTTVQAALQSLIRHSFFTTLSLGSSSAVASMQSTSLSSSSSSSPSSAAMHSDASLLQALDALQHCAAAPELASLLKTLTGSRAAKKKTKATPSSSSSIAASPSRSTASSATVSSSKTEAFEAIKRVVMTQRRIDGSRIPLATLAHALWLASYPLVGKSKRDVLVVQLAETPRDLFHRLHRLFYFQAALPFNDRTSLSSSSTSERTALAVAVKRLHEHALPQWPGLMVLFRRASYPTYTICIERHVFDSATAYVCYEVASRLHAVMRTLEQLLSIDAAAAADASGNNVADLDVKWIAFESAPQLLAFQKLIESVDDNDDDGFELLGADGDAVAPSTAAALAASGIDWQIESWRQFRLQLSAMTSLDDVVLESRRCFRAFTRWHKQQQSTLLVPAVPTFFARCSAGYHLARVLHHAVALYEKQRQYQVAVLLLNDLLDAPFLQRKRGFWWERLALNLEHLACAEQARRTCANALADVLVVGADRIALTRRLRRLERRAGGAAAVEKVAAALTPRQQQPTAADRDRDDFVSLLSDDDDDDNTGATRDTDVAVPQASDAYAYPMEHIVGRPLNRQTAEKSRFIGYDDEPCTVEQLVLQHYRSQHGGWYGVHCEGRVVGNIFGLCAWRVLYASVSDVFQTPFQAAPLDFGDADAFVAARRDAIDAALHRIEHTQSIADVLDAMATTWHREFGTVSRFVSWPTTERSSLPLAFHQLVVLAMGTTRLAKLLQYMLTSPEYHRAQNGLPDLLVLRAVRSPTTKAQQPDAVVASSTPELLVDVHGCLDIYALCGMTYQLNLNDSVRVEAGSDTGDARQQQSLVDQLDGWELELKLVEVKGPRDRLSDKQTLWLEVLNDVVGLDASVTHVVEDAKTLEKKRQLQVAPRKRSTSNKTTKTTKTRRVKR